MSHIYVHSQSDQKNSPAAFVLGVLIVISLFAVLPILSSLPNPFDKENQTEITTVGETLPDAIVPDPPKINIEEKQIDKPVIEEQFPPITLTMLEQLMTPGDGGVGIAVSFNNLAGAIDDSAKVFLPDMLDKRPRALVAAKPLYPYNLRGVSGEVVVEFIIDADGHVRRPKVVKSTHWQFENPALESINKSRWQPGEKDGKPVKTLVSLTVSFKK